MTSTALLVMDVQQSIVERFAGHDGYLPRPADLDYRLTVLADGCLDIDPDVQRVLLEKVFPRQAEVVLIADWVAGLGRGNVGPP
jgi:hypothetical protein